MVETKARNRLMKNGEVLHRTRDVYGCSGYYICDFNNVIVYGMPPNDLLALEDVEDYINENEGR